YDLVTTPMSWSSAQNYCRMKYTDLAIILSDTDKLRLKKEAASKGLATAAWVGVYKEINSWIWSLNNLPLSNVPYSNWDSGEPDNYGGIEACVIIRTNSQWNDETCIYQKAFICYNDKFSGAARFIGVSSPTLSWFDAQTYCQTYHTDLASALNSSDNDMLGVMSASQGDSWIGLRRDTWMWSDGTLASGLSWAPGEPGNYVGIKRCAALNNGLYYDLDCSVLFNFFCDTITLLILRTVPHYYELVMTKMTWSSAQNYCRMKYTDLAIILSDTDKLRLKKEAASKGQTTAAWVGVYKEINSWIWSLNNLPLSNVPYRNWCPGEPNNGGNQMCVFISTVGNWYDDPCLYLKAFICYNDKFSGAARFIGISSPAKTWFDAQTYCQTYHTDLASALNSSDNDMLGVLSARQGVSWIGLRRGTWMWSDGTFASGFSWALGQPDNNGGIENCVSLKNGLYYDTDCSLLFNFFCGTITVSILRTVPHSYDLMTTPMTWSSAQNYCRKKYTDLAIILSDTDKLRLKKEAASKGLAAPAWVGVYKNVSSFIWSLNNLPLSNVPYSNWCLGEPNNYGGTEACVIISTNSKWYDIPCLILKPFICYNAKFSGAARFIGMTSPTKTWFDAQTYCQTYHTDLASALNSSDNGMLGVISARQGDSWIGLTRDTWMWSDGTFASGLSWAPGQPGNYVGIKRCATLNNGLYYDTDCNLLLYFFCDTITVSILRTVPHKYDLMLTPMSWSSAQNYCRMKYTDLAIILSDTDKLRLNKETASKGLVAPAWVGVYKEITSWSWSLNNLPLLNIPFSSWYTGEPNNAGGYEACVVINTDGNWYDVACWILKPFICYNAKFSGAARFIGISSPLMTWFDAQTYCQTYHTDLASALNSSDNGMLWVVSARKGSSWFGLRRDTWMWSDGTFATGISWGPGQPDNSGGIEGCAVLDNGLYNDVTCGSQYYFFCHT
ncbi:C-type mannose receptor 2-like, partial [Silurus meridionalis]